MNHVGELAPNLVRWQRGAPLMQYARAFKLKLKHERAFYQIQVQHELAEAALR
jgi:hypothetical protein